MEWETDPGVNNHRDSHKGGSDSEGDMMMETEKRDGVAGRGPQTKTCRWPLKTENSRK